MIATPKHQELKIARQLAERRAELMAEAGLSGEIPAHFKRPAERPYTKRERGTTTILLGGLTLQHDRLVKAALEGLGYKLALVPIPQKADFQAGKEYGNNGQCNPTYFTVGALVNYLKHLRDEEGLATADILRDYVLLTAGACGPCRFGMYEAEYRLALRNSGFDGFRVILFQQSGGLSQSEVEAGLELNLNFFLSILNAIFMGDLLNEVACHIRPYEVVPGKTDEVFEQCLAICEATMRTKDYAAIQGRKWQDLLARLTPLDDGQDIAKFLDQLRSTWYTDAFRRCAELIDRELRVDYTRAKPIVKITGEFWAQTTEGDGNFNMFRFLEREGAEVLVEPVATWIAYLINQAKYAVQDRRGLTADGQRPKPYFLGQRLKLEANYRKSMFALNLAGRIVEREVERLRAALGGTAHELAPQPELLRMGHPFYHSRSGGGEGHLEVAKNIYYTHHELCHMVLSLKPFGCMPSTQSDGAQAAVTSRYPDMIYLPIETSGEGDINAYSRVQMGLGEAKFKCKDEFQRALQQSGRTPEELRTYVQAQPELQRPLQHVPKHPGFIGRAANFVLMVAERMAAEPTGAAR